MYYTLPWSSINWGTKSTKKLNSRSIALALALVVFVVEIAFESIFFIK